MHQRPSWKTGSSKKLLATAVAAAALWVSGPAAAHEVVPLPAKRTSVTPGTGGQAPEITERLLVTPALRPGSHLSFSPASLDFGNVLVGTTSERVLTLVNVTADDTLRVDVSADGPVTTDPESLTLLPGESAPLILTYSPTAAGHLAGKLRVASGHAGVATAVSDEVELAGNALLGPELELRINGLPATAFDFGEQARRPSTLEDAPQFALDVVNVGDLPADVRVVLFGVGIGGIGACSGGGISLCVSGDQPVASTSTFLPAGASWATTWRLFVNEVGTFTDDVTLQATGSLNGTEVVRSASLAVTAEGVPYLRPAGQAVATPVTAGGNGSTYAFTLMPRKDEPIGGDNVDSASNDPFANFRPKGFDALGTFQNGDVDNVEVQSGSLTVAIPIGQRFTARGALDYSLTAHFNSNMWSRKSIWANSSGRNVPYNSEYPDPANNTGMGWSFHLGRLLEPVKDFEQHQQLSHEEKEWRVDTGVHWVYVSPDASQHRFSRKLNHATRPFDETVTPMSDRTFLYTRDGSRLRLRRVSATERHVEFPDGAIHVFERFTGQVRSQPDPWRLVRIVHLGDESHSPAAVTIGYSDLSWTISDPWRSHTVSFQTTPSPFYPAVVDKVTLQGFDGAPARVYDFAYTLATHVERPISDRFHRTFVDPQAPSLFVDVPILDRVTLPDGTAYAMTYDRAAGSASELQILKLETPAGARIRYEYRHTTESTVQHCILGEGGVTGVGVKRRYVVAGGGTVLADSRYLRQANRHLPDAWSASDTKSPCGLAFPEAQTPGYQFSLDTPATELVVGIWSQLQSGLSSLETRYYSIWPFQPYDPKDDPRADHPGTRQEWTNREKNLNMTRAVTRGGRFLASRRYTCGVNISALALPDDVVPLCDLEESTYVKYQLPRTDLCEPKAGVPCHTDARLAERETVYETDLNGSVPRSTLRVYSDYDGLGHFRSSVLSSTFPNDLPSTTFTDYNSGNGTLILHSGGTPAQDGTVFQDINGLPDPWLLDTFTTRTVTQDGVTVGGESCFDSGTGRLRYRRTWEGSSAGPKDVLVRFEHNTSGEVVKESHYGADTGNVPAVANLCQISGLPAADFTVRNQYQSGVMSRRHVEGQSVNEFHQTVDANTGWAKTTILDTGELRTFSYDAMGRVTSITGPETAASQVVYRRVDNGAVKTWQVEARTFPRGNTLGNAGTNFCNNPGAGGYQPLTVLCTDLDELGRTRGEKVLRPGNVWATQTRSYHKSGLLASVSSINTPNKKTFFTYDFRGRPRRTTRPDASLVRTSYTGVRKQRTITEVLGTSGIIEVVTKKEMDAQGRVVSVTTPHHYTRNRYDPKGRLLRSTRKASDTATDKQERIYKVDGRGFVTSENLPELDVKTVTSDFNTRGQARRVVQGSRVQVKTYDDLGRSTQIKVGGRVLKTWEYGDSGPSNGRLVEAVRHNYRTASTNAFPESGDYVVTSSFQHDGGGRVDYRRTELVYDPDNGPAQAANVFEHSWTYDDLGNIDRLTYPTCDPACQVQGRTVDYNYARGLLTAVVEPGLGATLSYHRDGMVYQVAHDSGGADTYGADSDGMPRVGSVNLGGGALYLGGFTYDPSGNVTAIGADTFRYDDNSRLVDARVQGNHYVNTFDEFDNLTSYGTVDRATNRLEGGAVVYDTWGNLTAAAAGASIAYDELDKVIKATSGPATAFSVYDHDDLRILMNVSGSLQQWTLRDLAGRVLREFEGGGAGRVQTKDYVYAGSRQLSAREFTGATQVTRHYHTDHLGTARLITSSPGGATQQHFGPFGSAIAEAGFERMTYTGHEENGDGLTYYMRGRNYLPAVYPGPGGVRYEAGRFLQVDPARSDGWSMYSYARNNPLKFLDPGGLEVIKPGEWGVKERSLKDLSADELMRNIVLEETMATVLDGVVNGALLYGMAGAATTAVKGGIKALKSRTVLVGRPERAKDLATLFLSGAGGPAGGWNAIRDGMLAAGTTGFAKSLSEENAFHRAVYDGAAAGIAKGGLAPFLPGLKKSAFGNKAKGAMLGTLDFSFRPIPIYENFPRPAAEELDRRANANSANPALYYDGDEPWSSP